MTNKLSEKIQIKLKRADWITITIMLLRKDKGDKFVQKYTRDLSTEIKKQLEGNNGRM